MKLRIFVTFVTIQATLMGRYAVLSLPLQLEFLVYLIGKGSGQCAELAVEPVDGSQRQIVGGLRLWVLDPTL